MKTPDVMFVNSTEVKFLLGSLNALMILNREHGSSSILLLTDLDDLPLSVNSTLLLNLLLDA
jgi:hypothetical protein